MDPSTFELPSPLVLLKIFEKKYKVQYPIEYMANNQRRFLNEKFPYLKYEKRMNFSSEQKKYQLDRNNSKFFDEVNQNEKGRSVSQNENEIMLDQTKKPKGDKAKVEIYEGRLIGVVKLQQNGRFIEDSEFDQKVKAWIFVAIRNLISLNINIFFIRI